MEKDSKKLEFNKIELENENDNIIEECDRADRMLGCYLKEIFNYMRDNEVIYIKNKINIFIFLGQIQSQIQLHLLNAKGYQ